MQNHRDFLYNSLKLVSIPAEDSTNLSSIITEHHLTLSITNILHLIWELLVDRHHRDFIITWHPPLPPQWLRLPPDFSITIYPDLVIIVTTTS